MLDNQSAKGVWTVDGKRFTTPEYRSWQAMRTRCFNRNSKDYQHYGGKGISVHPRWGSFQNFLSDMGGKPTPSHTLERLDGSLSYGPGNCVWADRKQQARNRAYCKTRAWVLAEKLGVSQATANHYIWQWRRKKSGNPPANYEVPQAKEHIIEAHMKENDQWTS